MTMLKFNYAAYNTNRIKCIVDPRTNICINHLRENYVKSILTKQWKLMEPKELKTNTDDDYLSMENISSYK